MMTFFLVLIALVSVAVNVILVFYIREFFAKVNEYTEEVDGFFGNIKEFQDHLRSVYRLPLYTGEEQLFSLLRHTNQIADEIDVIGALFEKEEDEEPEEFESIDHEQDA